MFLYNKYKWKELFHAAEYQGYAEHVYVFCCPREKLWKHWKKIWKENLVWSGGEWYYDFMCLGKKLVMQMVAKELWYPFIPPSKGYVPVYPFYLLQTWIINGIAPVCFHPQK